MRILFPKEIIENTVQGYLPQHATQSKIIYGILLTIFITAFAVLPLIKIQLYSRARGLIKPGHERTLVTSLHSGTVLFSKLFGNGTVREGDTLLILQSAQLKEQLAQEHYAKERLQKQILDLQKMVTGQYLSWKGLVSSTYKKAYLEYQEQLQEHYSRIAKLKADFDRNTKLFSRGVIAQVAYEDQKLEYDLARNALHQFKKGQLHRWQVTLVELEDALQKTQHEINRLNENKKEYVITAPVSGTLLNIKNNVAPGSILTAGVVLAEVSPDLEVLAECYVTPSDIGGIDPSKPVKFQIDAYNHNQWGLATGNVLTIGKDVELFENTPVYKIRCGVDQDHLQLKNGAKGKLMKGMSFTARFELAERSLFQLLYDKVNDWIHPGTD